MPDLENRDEVSLILFVRTSETRNGDDFVEDALVRVSESPLCSSQGRNRVANASAYRPLFEIFSNLSITGSVWLSFSIKRSHNKGLRVRGYPIL